MDVINMGGNFTLPRVPKTLLCSEVLRAQRNQFWL